MGDFREANGAILEDFPSSSSPWSGPETPDPLCFGLEEWVRAERVTQEIISRVQPTVVSEERRRDVVDYVQRLIRNRIGCEVFPFGSVPLKTYLPDGDIDLTAFCDFNLEEGLANDVYSVLDAEDRNPAAELVVKDVQYIQAEVKLVKCLVQNIVVDISFNQIGGLCTLCFLEQVNLRIGKDHLFKRSIILIKAWCYYESRILGAHHGLISTYALEILVLYIFHRFNTSLNGPLEVLYKFLDYYSKFEWENFCVSLNGPIHLSSMPELVGDRAERPESRSGDTLFSSDFFKECVDIFSVPSKGSEALSKIFVQKHLNIVDPLKDFNNLGRSVSKGNFFRIRSAISFGARKLGIILSQSEENIAEEVSKFFANTLDRHGRGQRPDVEDPITGGSCPNGIISSEMRHDTLDRDWESISLSSSASEYKAGLHGARHGAKAAEVSAFDAVSSGAHGVQLVPNADNVRGTNASVNTESKSPFGGALHAPHLYFSYPYGNSKVCDGESDEKAPWDSSGSEDALASMGPLQTDDEKSRSHQGGVEHHEIETLSNLAGDYDSHLNSWQYGRWWFNHASGTPPVQSNMPSPSPLYLRKAPWETMFHSVHSRQNMCANIQTNGVIPRPPFFHMNPARVPGGAAFGMELTKARGTGMYFPNTNHQFYRERSSPVKPSKPHRYNSRGFGSPDKSRPSSIDSSCEPLLQMQSPVRQSNGKLLLSSDSSQDASSPSGGKVPKGANGLISPLEKAAVEVGSLGDNPPESVWLESSWRASPGVPADQNPSSKGPSPSEGQSGKPMFLVNADRFAARSYHLRDEEDFPPLSI
ncbi:hypothetical protein Dimus_006910 [Dionaea muscipula]